jgi:fido (protein-threonine AMPylation protein)
VIFRVLIALSLLLSGSAFAEPPRPLCGANALWKIFSENPFAPEAREAVLNEILERWTKRPSKLFSNSVEARRFMNASDWKIAQKKDPLRPWSYYGEETWNDWLNGARFVAKGAQGEPLSEKLLKKIHRISNQHNEFSGFYRRRSTDLEMGAPVPSQTSLLGKYRTDEFVHNGELMYGNGERFLTRFEIERASRNPLLKVDHFEAVIPGVYTGAISFPAPTAIPKLVKDLIQDANTKLAQTPGMLEKITIISQLEKDLITVHPFFDGNGRSIRFLTDLAYTRLGLPAPYVTDRWDMFMTVNERIGFTLKGMLEHAKQAEEEFR